MNGYVDSMPAVSVMPTGNSPGSMGRRYHPFRWSCRMVDSPYPLGSSGTTSICCKSQSRALRRQESPCSEDWCIAEPCSPNTHTLGSSSLCARECVGPRPQTWLFDIRTTSCCRISATTSIPPAFSRKHTRTAQTFSPSSVQVGKVSSNTHTFARRGDGQST